MSGASTVEPLGVGWALSTTLAVTRRNLATLTILGVVLAGVPALLPHLPGASWSGLWSASEARTFQSAAAFLSGLLQSLQIAAATPVVLADRDGRRASLGTTFAFMLRCALPVMALTLATDLGVVVGLVLLVIPGVVVFLNWLVAVPARAAEGPGVQRAMARSRELVLGNRWRCFALFILTYLLPFGALSAAEAVIAAFGYGDGSLPDLAAVAVFTAAASVLYTVAMAVAFVRLRELRDGEDASGIEAVFA